MFSLVKILIGRIYLKGRSFINACIYESYFRKYRLNRKFRFNGTNILFYGEGEIQVGDHSYIGDYSTIQAFKGFKVKIGISCQISHNVRIYTMTDVADQDFSKPARASKGGDVIISDYVWIGANVFINPGVKLGKNCIVGANSVVTKDVEENAIVGGVPARLIRLKSL